MKDWGNSRCRFYDAWTCLIKEGCAIVIKLWCCVWFSFTNSMIPLPASACVVCVWPRLRRACDHKRKKRKKKKKIKINQPRKLLTVVMTRACTHRQNPHSAHWTSMRGSFKKPLSPISCVIWFAWALAPSLFAAFLCVHIITYTPVRDKDAEDSCLFWQAIFVYLCWVCQAI